MTRNKSKYGIEIATAVLSFGLGSIASLATACSSPAAAASERAEPAAIAVDALVVQAERVPRSLTLTGTLVADRQAAVAADASGKVVQTFVERGDHVAFGAPLARLDALSAALARDEATASALALSAQEQNARLECQRAERLFAANVISRAELDRASSGCASSTQSLAAARARAGISAKVLGDTLVRAPFAGIVSERSVTVGEYLVPGRTVATVVDVRDLRIELTVPESAIGSVSVGREVSFGVAAYPNREFSGRVTRIAPSVRTSSRDEVVEVGVGNTDEALRPGMFAVARLTVGEELLPVVPVTAITGEAPSERAFVIRGERVEERVVATGERRNGRVAINKGIGAGERVVAMPTAALRDGARVK